MKLSIVATLYKSAPHIEEFHRRASSAAQELVGEDYEIVFVNDGSPDDSLQRAVALHELDDHVTVVDLSRNFGHHKAMMTGLQHAEGELVFLIDSDLEEEPEWLLDFSDVMLAQQADVVFGVQQQRKGGWFERWSGELYYSILNRLCNIDHPRNIVTARLMSKRYVDALLLHQEREIVISCLWVITGFKQCEKPVKKHAITETTYSLLKRVGLAVSTITSFSEVPLRLIFYCGICLMLISMTYAGYLITNRLFFAQTVDGWTSVMVSVWVLGGIIISFMGIIGLYLSKIFTEIKQRPLTLVRKVYEKATG